MDWIAEGLSSLGFFLEPCRHGREPAEEAIELFFRRYEKRDEAPATRRRKRSPRRRKSRCRSGPGARPPRPARRARRGGRRAARRSSSRRRARCWRPSTRPCRSAGRPDDREALTTIRRGFHTLKGSGRMVGLMDLGEAAWEVERVMNLWLEQKRGRRPRLLELLTLPRHRSPAGSPRCADRA